MQFGGERGKWKGAPGLRSLIPAWGGGLFSLERYTSLAKREETAGRFQDAMCCSCCFQVIYATAMWQEQCAVVQLGSLLLKDCLLLCSLEGDAVECNADQRLHPCGLSFFKAKQ